MKNKNREIESKFHAFSLPVVTIFSVLQSFPCKIISHPATKKNFGDQIILLSHRFVG
jgi:hypothetical protein